MALGEGNTLPPVAKTKRVSRTVLDAFAAVLKKWVDEEYKGNQTHAGKALGVTQSHVSAMLNGVRGPGLNTLILMRDKTGYTIDQMLGLDPIPVRTAADEAAMRRVSREEYRALLAELAAHDREQIALRTASKRKKAPR